MPKPNFVLTTFQKNELYKQLCLQIGFPIRTKLDCKKVSELIENSGLSGISESTIYRLFLLSTNVNHPYLHTLNILVQFCGYKDWNEFETVQNETEQFIFGFGKFQTSNSNLKSLITVCIHTNELKPLLLYTEQFEDVNNEKPKAKFAEEIFQSVLTNQNNDSFFKKFSHFSVIREHFFEILADPTFSIPGYEAGIQYYLKGLKHEASDKDLQDVIFGNCLLFRHYYITKQKDKALKIGKVLFAELKLSPEQLDKLHMFPVARYWSCMLMYFDLNNQSKASFRFFEQLLDELSKKMNLLTIEEQRIVFYSLAESLAMNTILQEAQHLQLKALFAHLFEFFPKHLIEQNLDKIVPYFNKNSSIYQF
jgi:hypothetical protein